MRLLLISALFLNVYLMAEPLMSQEWQLVWADEFDGDTLDMTKWSYQIGDGSLEGLPSGWGNKELQYYRAENVSVGNGVLTITAKQEQFDDKEYTSARIRTKHKADWTYGKFELRAKMPKGQGFWPALWMLPTDNVYGGWAASGEIDIMEYLGHDPKTVHGTLHFGGEWPENQHKGKAFTLSEGNFYEEFHTFTLEWERGEIRWYVDGEWYQTQNRGDWWSSGVEFPAPFDQDFHLLINLAVGGNWPGNPDATTQFPQQLVVDYVRVYQHTMTGVNDQWPRPTTYALQQNYPNPFNSKTVIPFCLPTRSWVFLEMFDLQGNKIQTILGEEKAPGQHQITVDAHGLASGVYFYRFHAQKFSETKRMILLQ